MNGLYSLSRGENRDLFLIPLLRQFSLDPVKPGRVYAAKKHKFQQFQYKIGLLMFGILALHFGRP